MPGLFDRLRKITGQDTPEAAAGTNAESPDESGVRRKTQLSGGIGAKQPHGQETIDKIAAQQREDLVKLDELRKKMADQEAAEALKKTYGGKKQFMKEAQKAADAMKLNIQREKESEEKRIQEQRAAAIKELQAKATRMGIDKDLELWDQKLAEEKARRERLELE